MSGDIVSKNLFDVLGNDPELDPDRAPEPPTKAIDKPVARSGKRNGPTEAPARDSGRAPRGGRSDGATGNELAFRDRNAGRDANRRRPAEDGERGNYRGRGRGRGGRGGGSRDDRHSKTGISEHDKQAAHGWGGQTGNEELADEKAGDAQVDVEKKDEAEAANEAEGGADAVEPEEDKTKSYAAWQAEQEAKRAALGQSLEVRKANEGASKKFPEGKAIAREESEDFIAGTGGKKKRDRERKEKTVVELDNPRMYDQPREQSGRGRGGRGGRGEFRGEGRGRGGGGGGRGRGEFRGGRGGRGGASGPNVTDEKAFPSLGA